MTPADLRTLRQRLGMTQQQLAEAVGVSRTTVKFWETGLRTMTESHDRLIRLVAEREIGNATRHI